MKRYQLLFFGAFGLLLFPIWNVCVSASELGSFEDHTTNEAVSGSKFTGTNGDVGKEDVTDTQTEAEAINFIKPSEYDGIVTELMKFPAECKSNNQTLFWNANDEKWECDYLESDITGTCTDNGYIIKWKNGQWGCIDPSTLSGGDEDWTIKTDTISTNKQVIVGAESPQSNALLDVTANGKRSLKASEAIIIQNEKNKQLIIDDSEITIPDGTNLRIGKDDQVQMEIGENAWTLSNYKECPLLSTDEDGTVLCPSACTKNQTLVWQSDDNIWQCIDIPTQPLEICNAKNQSLVWDGNDWDCLDLEGSQLPQDCTDGDVLLWTSGSGWDCADPESLIFPWTQDTNSIQYTQKTSQNKTSFVGIGSQNRQIPNTTDTQNNTLSLRVGETPFTNIETEDPNVFLQTLLDRAHLKISDGTQGFGHVLTALDEFGHTAWIPFTYFMSQTTSTDDDFGFLNGECTAQSDGSFACDVGTDLIAKTDKSVVVADKDTTNHPYPEGTTPPRLIVIQKESDEEYTSPVTGIAAFQKTSDPPGTYGEFSFLVSGDGSAIAGQPSQQSQTHGQIVLGNSASAYGYNDFILGNNIHSGSQSSSNYTGNVHRLNIGIGTNVLSAGDGFNTTTDTELSSLAIGTNTQANFFDGDSTLALGSGAQTEGVYAMAIGANPSEETQTIADGGALAIGIRAKATGHNTGQAITGAPSLALSIGTGATGGANTSNGTFTGINIGTKSYSDQSTPYEFIGNPSNAERYPSVALGANSSASGQIPALAIGDGAQADNGLTIGTNTSEKSTDQDAPFTFSIGNNVTQNTIENSLLISASGGINGKDLWIRPDLNTDKSTIIINEQAGGESGIASSLQNQNIDLSVNGKVRIDDLDKQTASTTGDFVVNNGTTDGEKRLKSHDQYVPLQLDSEGFLCAVFDTCTNSSGESNGKTEDECNGEYDRKTYKYELSDTPCVQSWLCYTYSNGNIPQGACDGQTFVGSSTPPQSSPPFGYISSWESCTGSQTECEDTNNDGTSDRTCISPWSTTP